MPISHDDFQIRARRLRLLLLDVDGVLTDGTVVIDSGVGEAKGFFIRDGLAMLWAGRHGIEVGLLSGRPSAVTTRRAAELRLRIVSQGGASDKGKAYAAILGEHGFLDDEVAYMGDDLLDLPVLERVGLSTAPADAVEDVRARVHWVSQFGGGRGAVRELIELCLRARGQWDPLVQSFLP